MSKRCKHGFMGGLDCQECHPELMVCASCGAAGHESRLCPNTAVGRKRRADLAQLKRYKRRQANRIGADRACAGLSYSGSRHR